jgi:hypothetical protein
MLFETTTSKQTNKPDSRTTKMASSSKGKQPAPQAQDWRHQIDYEEQALLMTMEQLAALRCPFRLTPETMEEIPAEYTTGLVFCQNTMEPDSVPWIGYYAPYKTAHIAVANTYGVWFKISREHGTFRAIQPAQYSLQTKNWPSDGINIVTRGLRILREQLFLRLLLATCRASEYTLDLESCLGTSRQS